MVAHPSHFFAALATSYPMRFYKPRNILRRLAVPRFSFLTVSVFFFLGCHALADPVSLKNGDRLSGTMVKSDASTLVLHTDYPGHVSLKCDSVQGLQSHEPP